MDEFDLIWVARWDGCWRDEFFIAWKNEMESIFNGFGIKDYRLMEKQFGGPITIENNGWTPFFVFKPTRDQLVLLMMGETDLYKLAPICEFKRENQPEPDDDTWPRSQAIYRKAKRKAPNGAFQL